MNREQAKKLFRQILDGPLPKLETQLRWYMLVVDALLFGTEGDDEFERLSRRFSRRLAISGLRRISLGGCTRRLCAA